jgi:hypothetical protein
MNETKPGYKTTEFWLSAAASVVGLLVASGIIPTDSGLDKMLGMVVIGLSTMGYTVSRGIVKKVPPQITTMVLIFGLLAGGMLTGCKTPERTAYVAVGITQSLAVGAMNGWGDWVRSGRATDGDQVAVRQAWERYQGAVRVAKSVEISLKGSLATNDPVWIQVTAAVGASSTELIDLVRSLTSKPITPGTP